MAEAKGQVTQFPSQSVTDSEKSTKKYGLEVARGIHNEWFKKHSGSGRFAESKRNFHKLRLYARGEQSVSKYKDEFSVNGDLSYLNLDWTPVPIIPKFVDIVVNGMQDRLFTIKAFAQDPTSVKERTDFVDFILEDMNAQEMINDIEATLGINTRNVKSEDLPSNAEELELHMQLGYKQSIEIAIEQAIHLQFHINFAFLNII